MLEIKKLVVGRISAARAQGRMAAVFGATVPARGVDLSWRIG